LLDFSLSRSSDLQTKQVTFVGKDSII
jgi:hypothetical protein